MTRLGLDIGATRTRAVSCHGNHLFPLGVWLTPGPESLGRMLLEVRERARCAVRDLGVGFAAELDGQGRVTAWPNRPEYVGFDFRGLCQQVFDLDAQALALVDDCAAGAFGEHAGHTGGGDETSTLYVGWGTGVGAGAVLAGRPYLGARARAFALGHTRVASSDAVLCRCGQRGCLQALVAGPVLERRARGLGWSGSALARSAREGDVVAQSVLSAAAQLLGDAIGAAARLVDPDRVVLGGGLSEGQGAAFEPLARALLERAPGATLLSARFGIYSGAAGAALWTLPTAERRSICTRNLEHQRVST